MVAVLFERVNNLQVLVVLHPLSINMQKRAAVNKL